MIRTFFREVLRVGKATSSNLNVVVMMAFVMGLAAVSCDSSGQNHTHSGEEIDRGTVSESRIGASIARDNEIMPTVKANDGSGSGLDSDKLDGKSAEDFAGGLKGTGKAVDSDKLDGRDSKDFLVTAIYVNSDQSGGGVGNGAYMGRDVYCDQPGDTALGGGAEVADKDEDVLTQSNPITNQDGYHGWIAGVRDNGPSDFPSIKAYVVCADTAAPSHTS